MFENVPTDLFDTQDTLVSIENDFESVDELDDRSKLTLAFTHELNDTIQQESVRVSELIPLLSRNAGERSEMVVSEADVRFVVSNGRPDFLMNPQVFESITAAGGDVVTVWVKPRKKADGVSGRNVVIYARFPHLH